VAGIAAMLLAGIFGTAMGLNNTATYLASGVAFVAVSLSVDGWISRRRSVRRPAADAGKDAVGLDADSSKHEG